MANVDGSWDTVTQSPLGDQKARLTVRSEGSRFTGSYAGAMGSIEIGDGQVEGNTLRWTVQVTVPLPLQLDIEATVEGDTMEGKVTAGGFGSFPMRGTRVG